MQLVFINRPLLQKVWNHYEIYDDSIRRLLPYTVHKFIQFLSLFVHKSYVIYYTLEGYIYSCFTDAQ